MYETLDQAEPVFDAKGIETVRRDGCPAVAKVTPLKYFKSVALLYFVLWPKIKLHACDRSSLRLAFN